MTRILDRIDSPQDLHGLSLEELYILAQELREEIIHTVSQVGGHLGPNLGTVELTLALHSVLDSPRDRIVWDIGHQAYPHKLVTGRRDRFHTLRQYGGIAGFLRRDESPHDHFGAGHASTSLSAALGMAVARDRQGEKYAVVAVIGDGALTGGMAFEALNNAGQMGLDFVVVLNDNDMSISPNVGALSNYLTRLRMDPTLKRAREDLEWLMSKIPAIGGPMRKATERLKGSLRHLLVPGSFFQEMGFSYFGPFDGHDIAVLQKAIRDAVDRGGPVVLHVVTRKGKGYEPAEQAADKMHGARPFTVQLEGLEFTPRRLAAVPKKSDAPVKAVPNQSPPPPSYSKVVGQVLVELARKDASIVAITAAMPDGTGLTEFAKEFPERFFDVGIAEQHAVTFAAGLTTAGMRPVACIYSTFLQRGYDQVIHDVAVQQLPVTFLIDRAGLVGEDGPTHHGVFDIAYLRCVPGMVIMSPKDEHELRDMVKTAIYYDGPVAVRYPRDSGRGGAMRAPETLPIGRGETLREGHDVTLVALGPLVGQALVAAERLSAKGISAAVVNARFAKPLDEELLDEWARRTGRLVTIEDGAKAGGFGSAVLEWAEDRDDVWVKRLGIPDRFIEHGALPLLRREVGLDAESIADTVERWLRGADRSRTRRVGRSSG